MFGLVTDDPADAELCRWAPLGYAMSCVMVLMQCAVAVGVCTGTTSGGVREHEQCVAGTFCRVGIDRCTFCGSSCAIPLPLETEGTCNTDGSSYLSGNLKGYWTLKDVACTTRNQPNDPNFAGVNSTGIATVCADPSLKQWGKANIDSHLSWCDAASSRQPETSTPSPGKT